jgi:hypothetical protein
MKKGVVILLDASVPIEDVSKALQLFSGLRVGKTGLPRLYNIKRSDDIAPDDLIDGLPAFLRRQAN